jgi:hypothetical protein
MASKPKAAKKKNLSYLLKETYERYDPYDRAI